jgi:hypothetical protein
MIFLVVERGDAAATEADKPPIALRNIDAHYGQALAPMLMLAAGLSKLLPRFTKKYFKVFPLSKTPECCTPVLIPSRFT